MIRTLRAFFLSRALREKALLAGLALVLALWWLSNFSGRVGAFAHAARRTTIELTQQAQWLARRNDIMTAADSAAGQLDPSRTLDGPRLLAEVNNLAGEAGLINYSGSGENDESSGQFAVHTIEFTISKADWNSLKIFYQALQARSPYIGIEQFSMRRDAATPSQLAATLRISSIEVAH